MASPSTKRQQHFVNRTLQGGLLWQFANSWAINTFLLWHALFLMQVYGVLQPQGAMPASASWWGLYREFCADHADLAICALAIFPLFYWNALRLSHRIAGPLERFRVTLERLQQEQPVKPLTLRRDDLLVDYQQAFNRYLAYLQSDSRGRGGLPRTIRPEPDDNAEPASNPLIQELVSIQAEIHRASKDSPQPGNSSDHDSF